MAPPFIVCAELDDASAAVLDGLRRRHFPAERNVLTAHLTMFHHLEVPPPLAEVAAATGEMAATLGAPRSTGRGVAIPVECPSLVELRRRLAATAGELTPQDRQGYRPHVTIANKLSPQAARAVLEEVARTWEPRPAAVVGLSLWRYLGGPWEPAGRWELSAAVA